MFYTSLPKLRALPGLSKKCGQRSSWTEYFYCRYLFLEEIL